MCKFNQLTFSECYVEICRLMTTQTSEIQGNNVITRMKKYTYDGS